MANLNRYEIWGFDRGKPREFWASQASYVEKYVIANQAQLKKIDINVRAGINATAKASGDSSAMAAIKLPEWIDGGMRVPHIHYNGEIYLLTKVQWKQFSGQILKEFSKKLAETNTVSFDQLMELSDTMGSIV